MASSPTDYSVAGNGTLPGHDPIFANNLNSDATVVRPGAPWIDPAPPAATWLPLGMVVPFTYDPTLGNDFVFQIVKCGTNATWGQSIFGATGSAGANGGNRYGSTSSCAATSSTAQNNEYVPIILIDHNPAGGKSDQLHRHPNSPAGPPPPSTSPTRLFTKRDPADSRLWAWDFDNDMVIDSTAPEPDLHLPQPGLPDRHPHRHRCHLRHHHRLLPERRPGGPVHLLGGDHRRRRRRSHHHAHSPARGPDLNAGLHAG